MLRKGSLSPRNEWSDFVLSSGADRGSAKVGNMLASHLIMRTAVYAIGPQSGPPIKVGFTRRPVRRLLDLQIASPQDLRFHLVCWVAGKAEAVALEGRCHKILQDSGRHIRGEWFNLTPIEAAKAIDRASLDVGCRLAPHKSLIKRFPLSKDPLAGHFWSGVPGEQEAA